jgi:hypothetical protein
VCAPSGHAFAEGQRNPILFCARCGTVNWLDTPAPALPSHSSAARATPPSGGQIDEQAQLDAAIYNLMREGGLDPDDPVARATALEVAAEAEADSEAPVTIDGVEYTEHGASDRGAHRVPVDADLYNENLPDPGL